MNIYFYNVTSHPMTYPATLQRLSKHDVLHAFLRALARRHRDLTVKLRTDGRHGTISLKCGTVVAHFKLEL